MAINRHNKRLGRWGVEAVLLIGGIMDYHVIQWILAIALSAGAAWGGAKYAIGSHEERLLKHDLELEKIRVEIGLLTSKATTEKIQEALKAFMPIETCREKQISCFQLQKDYDSETAKKLDLLFKKIDELEAKRERQKDERNKIIAALSTQIAVLDNTIKQRAMAYRKENGHSPVKDTQPCVAVEDGYL